MSFFSSTSKVVNTSTIPASVRKAEAVALLHDHEFFLLCDPHHASHKTLPQPPETAKEPGDVDAARKHFKLPGNLEPLLPASADEPAAVVTTYEVVDHMPNPVWSSNVVSREEFVDHADGMWVRIRSPMGVVMETMWSVREKKKKQEDNIKKSSNSSSSSSSSGGGDGEGGGELELVEDVVINCSKLVMGIVKGQVENNWAGIHKQIIEKLVKNAEAGKGAETVAPAE
ncbi:hypothetical protein F5Y19DRAFT_368404 [Xylariaceae sp. FL1651]|nr:hypothetical protein F5Y19DRAFT_368404 [Xylariaceae sp. FL1651]